LTRLFVINLTINVLPIEVYYLFGIWFLLHAVNLLLVLLLLNSLEVLVQNQTKIENITIV